jgi:hypothetical protein
MMASGAAVVFERVMNRDHSVYTNFHVLAEREGFEPSKGF